MFQSISENVVIRSRIYAAGNVSMIQGLSVLYQLFEFSSSRDFQEAAAAEAHDYNVELRCAILLIS